MNSIANTTVANLFAQRTNDFLGKFIFYSCVIGLTGFMLGNILNIMICLRKRIRKEMMGFYNIIISIWNILALVSGFVMFFPSSIHIQDLLLVSDFSCVAINYVMRVCVQMSAWLHVFLTIDRYLCVAFNNKLKYIFNNRKRLSLIFLSLFALICVLNAPNFWFRLVSLTNKSNVKECTSSSFVYLIRNTIVSLFRIFLPIIFQVIFSALIIYKYFKIRRRVIQDTNRSMKKDFNFARIIVWLNLMFLITETPLMLITLYVGILGITPMYPLDVLTTPNLLTHWTLVYYVSQVFALYLFGSLFFVNLCINKLFKKEIRLIFF